MIRDGRDGGFEASTEASHPFGTQPLDGEDCEGIYRFELYRPSEGTLSGGPLRASFTKLFNSELQANSKLRRKLANHGREFCSYPGVVS
jgi:hypothetical protein